ncbi:uncharacterized protein LOC119792420 [Cyprinodon tularosa]|uniref:uncharacterized protein LOC119792420 n=1 Tax=Cyprinodon tularosa TaxID=77115 RepID=UPI0018E253E2|nr:uncharacterized protein LOC119792420 [Cyprinodon tularosa]
MMLPTVLLLMLIISRTQCSHYRGTMMTYYPQKTFSNGSVSVILRFKFNYQSCGVSSYSCTGNCGAESTIVTNAKIEEVSGIWCQSEKITSQLLPNNSPFQLVFSGGGWFNTLNNIYSWRAVTSVELRHRSDTKKINVPPQTTIFPALRVPSNCNVNINLLAFDPDEDEVRCRNAILSLNECASPCTPPPVLSLSSNCTLSFSATASSNQGWYVAQMVMEDFPRQSINLTHNDGSYVLKTTSDAISQIPMHFALLVDPAAPSCSEGNYLPRYLSPTPEHGTLYYSDVNQNLEINIRAVATHSMISELLYSGPSSVVKKSSGSGNFSLTWTPSVVDAGQSHPICFVVQGSSSSSVYQSELRCIVVTVGSSKSKFDLCFCLFK